MCGAVYDGRAVPVAVGQAVTARTRLDSRRAHRPRTDLETRAWTSCPALCRFSEVFVGVALRGHPSIERATWGGHGGPPLQKI